VALIAKGVNMVYEDIDVIEDKKEIENDDEIKSSLVLEDLRIARQAKKKLMEKQLRDFEFALGQQWDDADVSKLAKAGVAALTINKIQPNLFLISGIERQNRSKAKAFPEGSEDGVKADIASGLLANVEKRSESKYKLSEMFEDGCIGGEGYVEPYIDYTWDLLNGEMKIKKLNPFNVFPDPDGTEYDLSDCEYVVKLTPDLNKNQIYKLFPDKKKELDNIASGKLTLDKTDATPESSSIEEQSKGYDDGATTEFGVRKERYDLTEYYYKKYVDKWIIVDRKLGKISAEVDDKETAEIYVKKATEGDELDENGKNLQPSAISIKRVIPEIWICALVGNEKIEEYQSPFYPLWKSYPIIPFFAHRITTPMKERHLMFQGIVRGLIDPQRELNKRRTQEMRILNSSAHSGWLSEQGAWVKKNDVKKFGASAGVILEYKKDAQKPEKIVPTGLSQGHAQLAVENAQDMKEISGINADLLSMADNKNASGRAIHLRQQQGIVMVQRIFDNYGRTKNILAKFMLSQMGGLYTVDTAIKVMGTGFINDNFKVPVMVPSDVDGEEVPQMDNSNQMVMELDEEAVAAVFSEVLQSSEISKYDVAVGEGANTETVKHANYLLLMEMVEKGVQIPMDIIVDESLITSGSKARIKGAIQQAQARAEAELGQQV